MTERDKEYPLYNQFLEDFKARFGTWEEAQPTIKSLEAVLALYNEVVGNSLFFFSNFFDFFFSSRTCQS
jgi:hypothetical protein